MDDIYYLDYKDQQIKKFDTENIDYKLLKYILDEYIYISKEQLRQILKIICEKNI